MAAYNGSAHILEQLKSILAELDDTDEVVIVDDASTDDTVALVSTLEDSRIRLVRSSCNRGYVKTFEAALELSRGEFVFLADQDDIWLPGRVEAMIRALQKGWVVASNFDYFGHQPRAIESIKLRSADGNRRWTNLFALWIGYRPYYGCAMAIRREAKELVLPFPPFLYETHDQWIALAGNLSGRMVHLEEKTLSRRLHESNTTPKRMRNLWLIVRGRVMLLRSFFVALHRLRHARL